MKQPVFCDTKIISHYTATEYMCICTSTSTHVHLYTTVEPEMFTVSQRTKNAFLNTCILICACFYCAKILTRKFYYAEFSVLRYLYKYQVKKKTWYWYYSFQPIDTDFSPKQILWKIQRQLHIKNNIHYTTEENESERLYLLLILEAVHTDWKNCPRFFEMLQVVIIIIVVYPIFSLFRGMINNWLIIVLRNKMTSLYILTIWAPL